MSRNYAQTRLSIIANATAELASERVPLEDYVAAWSQLWDLEMVTGVVYADAETRPTTLTDRLKVVAEKLASQSSGK